jgi:leader peptidase (prepilin peptidase) / N-methyltransferase
MNNIYNLFLQYLTSYNTQGFSWFSIPIGWQYFFILLVGLCVGSFINVVVYRLPIIFEQELNAYINEHAYNDNNDKLSAPNLKSTEYYHSQYEVSLTKPASSCPYCGYKLTWLDNMPILSWLWLKGKCRDCNGKISIQYPLVEFACGVLSLFTYALISQQYTLSIIPSIAALLFLWIIFAIVLLDAKTQLLPTELTTPLIALGLLSSTYSMFSNNLFIKINANEAIYAFLIGFLMLWLVAFIFKKIRGYEGLGDGDPYLLGAIGAWVGIQAMLNTILYSSILGIIYVLLRKLIYKKDVNEVISFGPFIGIVGFTLFMLQNSYINIDVIYIF